MRSETKTWMTVRWVGIVGAAALGALVAAGCMEESSDLGQPGGPPPADGQGLPGGPDGGPPGAPGAPGAPNAGGAPGAPGSAGTGTAAPAPAGAGTAAPTAGAGTAAPTAGAGTAAPAAGSGTAPATTASAATGSTTSSPAATGSVPRVQKSLTDQPRVTQADLKAPGKAVTLTGTVTCATCKGTILLNVTDTKGLLTSLSGIKPGSFSILIPKSAGALSVTAIGDDNSDGMPTAGEILGGYLKNPITVGDSDISGISIEIGKAAAPPAAK